MRSAVHLVPAQRFATRARMRPTARCLSVLLLALLWPGIEPVAAGAEADSRAVEEMLRGSNGRLAQWTDAPELVVLTSVMQFQADAAAEYVATADVLSREDVDDLVTELTTALRLLTGNTFEHFSNIRLESAVPGTSVRVIRAHQIVVGRYRNVRHLAGILGLGGRSVRANGVITGAAVILDDDYDRTSPMRAQLRTHELGHALGYHHVESRESIMNPRIGTDATELDRRIATIAYSGSGHPR